MKPGPSIRGPLSIASVSGPATEKYDAEYDAPPAATVSAAGIALSVRSDVQVATSWPVVASVIGYDGFAGPGVPLGQLVQLSLKICCTTVLHGTPMTSFAVAGAAFARILRGVVPNIGVAPLAKVSSTPGVTLVVRTRSSWQPPHTRASPARPENQKPSLNSDMPNLSTVCRWSGTLAGTSADHEWSFSIGATPRLAWPSNIVVPNMRGAPSSDEKPSITRTPQISPS